MKVLTGAITGALVVYTVWQSYMIASTGVIYQIPQLEGDGGGGMVFAGLCLIAGIILLLRPLISAIVYFLAGVLMLFVALAYIDHVEFLWAVVAFALSILSFLSRRTSSQSTRKSRKGAVNKNTEVSSFN